MKSISHATFPRSRSATFGALVLLAASASAAPPASTALPSGGQVVSGSAVIGQAGNRMTIDQSSAKAILNWNSFDIGSAAAVRFNQPSASAVVLNRVLSIEPSVIYGQLRANGHVFLINPNGIIFGQGARVDVGGLVASTLSLSDTNFLDGNYRFSRNGSTGSILNQGEVNARYVALLAPEVRNEGVISANMGTVALVAGDAVTLNITGQDLVDVQVDKASIDTLVDNRRLVQAGDGTVILAAQSAHGLLGQVVNSGQVEANGIVADGGTIRFTASSSINNTGRVSANATDRGKGGTIVAVADLSNPDSRTVVDGTWSATGGRVTGDGGFIETSASHLSVADNVRISTLAPQGKSGQWLLDPNDFTISASGTGGITGAALTAALAGGDVTITTTAGNATCVGVGGCTVGTAGVGDINVNDSVTIGAGHYLSLNAYRNIKFSAKIAVNSDASTRLYLWYGMKGAAKPGAIVVNAGGGTTGAGNNIKGGNFVTEAAHTYPILGNLVYTPPNVDVYVRASSGTSVYGDTPGYSYGIYTSASAGKLLGLSPTGSVAWSTSLSPTTNVGSYSLTYTGSFSLSGYAFHPGTAATWTITPRPITAAVSKTYDGTTTFNSGFVITNLANNDTLSISGRTSSADAGTYNSLSNLNLGNSNYSLTSVKATIVPATVALTASRVYDGSPDIGTSYAYTPAGIALWTSRDFSPEIPSPAMWTVWSTPPEALNSLSPNMLQLLAANGLIEQVASFKPATSNFNYTLFTVSGPAGAPQPQLVSGTASVTSATPGTYTDFVNNNLVLSDNHNYTFGGAPVSATITKAKLGIEGLPAQAAQGYPLAASTYTYGVTVPSSTGNAVTPISWSSFLASNPGLISGVPSVDISAISNTTLPGTYQIPIGPGALTSSFFDFTFKPASLTVLAIPKLDNLIQGLFNSSLVALGMNRIGGTGYDSWSRATGVTSSTSSDTVQATLKQITSSEGLGVTVVYGSTSYGQGRIKETMSSLTAAVNQVLQINCPPCNPVTESALSAWLN